MDVYKEMDDIDSNSLLWRLLLDIKIALYILLFSLSVVNIWMGVGVEKLSFLSLYIQEKGLKAFFFQKKDMFRLRDMLPISL